MYDNGHKQEYIQKVLERALNVLPLIPASLLKVRLLTYCYGEVYAEELAKEAHAIIDSWGTFRLTAEQEEAMEELKILKRIPIRGKMLTYKYSMLYLLIYLLWT